MKVVGVRHSECEDGKTCPQVLEIDQVDHVLVQGDRVDPAVIDAVVPKHEALVRVPRRLVDGTPRMMAPEEFGNWYDAHLTRSMQRLETLPYYDPDRGRLCRVAARRPNAGLEPQAPLAASRASRS